MSYWNKALEEILSAGEIMIYGAGVMGRAVKSCLESAPYEIKVYRAVIARESKACRRSSRH